VSELSEPPTTEAGLLQKGAALIEARLPGDWQWKLDKSQAAAGFDAVATISPPAGRTATLIIEVKQTVEGRGVANLQAQLQASTATMVNAVPVVMARYLSQPVQQRLLDAGLSYVDMTGNINLRSSSPGLFISDRGSDADPWRGPGRPLGTLKGAPAAKVVRTLADFNGTWTVRELVGEAATSTGSTYRVLDFLERDGLVVREENGRLVEIDWPQMLRRWSTDYGFVDTNEVTRWIAPRGIEPLMKRIAERNPDSDYAVTGTIAAAQWAPYAPARMAMIYAANPEAAAAEWGLRLAEAGANVILGQPKFDAVYARSEANAEGVIMASPSQVVVDLMTGPGRNPSEAEELLTWMQRNEGEWRRDR